jgi:hypothetical protein
MDVNMVQMLAPLFAVMKFLNSKSGECKDQLHEYPLPEIIVCFIIQNTRLSFFFLFSCVHFFPLLHARLVFVTCFPGTVEHKVIRDAAYVSRHTLTHMRVCAL